MDVFSGRPNPSWELTEKQTKGFFEFSGWKEMVASEEIENNMNLGYRGFVISKVLENGLKTDLPDTFRLINTYRKSFRTNVIKTRLDRNEMISRELWLLKTMGSQNEFNSLIPYFKSSIKETLSTSYKEKTSKIKMSPVNDNVVYPPYDPDLWNWPYLDVRLCNNCYNYACQVRFENKDSARPGRASGHELGQVSCESVSWAAITDGMTYDLPEGVDYYLVALAVDPERRDFHFYICQQENFWAGKAGAEKVTNLDNAGNIILDPQSCDRYPYTQFCGFFYCPLTIEIE